MEGLMQPGSSSSSAQRSYTDFDPPSQWIHGDESDTLILDTTGFSKEQMKVLINTSGSLKISGERPLEDSNKWLRFVKNYEVSKNCDRRGVEAKFDKDKGLLYIVLPKKQAHAQTQEPLLIPSTKVTTSTDISNNAEQIMKKQRSALLTVAVAIALLLIIGSYLAFRFRFLYKL